MNKILDSRREKRDINLYCGKRCGEVGENKYLEWGKVEGLGLSTKGKGYPQSYPPGFPRVLQRVVRQSTGSTTTTTFI